MDTIQDLLDQYARAQRDLENFQATCDSAKAEVMTLIPAPLAQRLMLLDEQQACGIEGWNTLLSTMAEAIKAEVLKVGHTVKGHGYTAVFTNGRALWDDAFLQGYAAAHDEILQGRREGKPSVSLQKDK